MAALRQDLPATARNAVRRRGVVSGSDKTAEAAMPDARTRIESRPINVGGGERAVSIALGGALLWRALGGAVLGRFLLSLGGAALIWRGVAGHCAVKEAMQADGNTGGDGPRRSGRRTSRRNSSDADPPDAVHRASEDSFPASDPPSWIPANGPVRRH